VGVVMFVLRPDTVAGRIGRVVIGLGLITLALQLIVAATQPLTASPAVRALLVALPNETSLHIVVGAVLTVAAYSSLAIVLLTATLAASGLLPTGVALGLVLGANVGSGLLALVAAGRASPRARRLPLGNLLFKTVGALVAIPLLRGLDDTVDDLYSAIKFYLTQISREALSERESRRWTDIVSFTINMEQIGDIIERVLQDVEDKKIRKNRRFSDAGMAEICHLHERLMSNLRLGMGVFLDGHVRDARRLLEEKASFRDLEHEYAASHIARLRDNTAQSIETSSLHLDLISDLKRINSHICSIAYPILESAGALSKTRIRESRLPALPPDARGWPSPGRPSASCRSG